MPAIETEEAPACQRMVLPGAKPPTRYIAWVAVIHVFETVSMTSVATWCVGYIPQAPQPPAPSSTPPAYASTYAC